MLHSCSGVRAYVEDFHSDTAEPFFITSTRPEGDSGCRRCISPNAAPAKHHLRGFTADLLLFHSQLDNREKKNKVFFSPFPANAASSPWRLSRCGCNRKRERCQVMKRARVRHLLGPCSPPCPRYHITAPIDGTQTPEVRD